MQPKVGQIWKYNNAYWLVIQKRLDNDGFDIYNIRNGHTSWSYIVAPKSEWKLIQDIP